MKRVIFFSLAALAVAVLAVPEAEGWWYRTLDVRIAGSNFITSDEDGVPTPVDGRPIVAIQNGIAKGSGAFLFSSNAELEQVSANPLDYPPACLDQGLAGAPLTVSFVIMYRDGSLLSLFAGPGSFFCTDGTDFTVEVMGTVTGGEKRFAGATGTFVGSASSSPPRVVGDLEIDLD